MNSIRIKNNALSEVASAAKFQMIKFVSHLGTNIATWKDILPLIAWTPYFRIVDISSEQDFPYVWDETIAGVKESKNPGRFYCLNHFVENHVHTNARFMKILFRFINKIFQVSIYHGMLS